MGKKYKPIKVLKKDEEINCLHNNKYRKWTITLAITSSLLLIGIIIIGIYLFDTKNVVTITKGDLSTCESELSSCEFNYEYDSNQLNKLLDGNSYYYVQQKLNLFDEKIVFVIEGYGNYYYSYDCMIKKTVGDDNYSYWAYNIEAAKGNGYKKGTCK